MRLTQKRIVQMNDEYREYKEKNPESDLPFIDFRRKFILKLKKMEIEKIKREYQKNRKKIKRLEKEGKVVFL